jgi:hypothetical protein
MSVVAAREKSMVTRTQAVRKETLSNLKEPIRGTIILCYLLTVGKIVLDGYSFDT